MGLFDDFLDAIIESPGKIVEGTVETVARVPEAGIKTVQGALKGAEKALEKLEETVDELID